MEKASTEKKHDPIDRLVAWGCKVFHLTRYQKMLTQIAKFVITGFIATAIDWTIFYILVYWAKMDPLVAQIFAFSLSTLFNYYSNTRWVFNITKNKTKKRLASEFLILSMISLVISELLLYVLINVLGMNDMLAKIISTAIVMVFNFVTRKLFLEDRQHKESKKRDSI